MLLEDLSSAPGVSSREDQVRNTIKDFVKDRVDEFKVDINGNLICKKEGNKKGPSVMLAAHMDEVGLMITEIRDDGLLKFMTVGGIDKRILVSRVVEIGDEQITGVIGAKAIHLQKKEERKKPIEIENLYIDIGVSDRNEAEKLVSPGDVAVFKSEFKLLDNNKALGKAFDDRAGCHVLAELTKIEPAAEVFYVFTVQEEVGLRGAGQAAFEIDPDLALVVEGTTAADIPDNVEHRYSTTLGEGPALTVRDRSIITSRSLLQSLIDTARKYDIPYQFRRTTAGGNDAGVIHLTREGIPAAVVSVPCRYIHSPSALMDIEDLKQTKKLIEKFLTESIKEGKLKL